MQRLWLIVAVGLIPWGMVRAQVLVTDQGVQKSIAGPGAPAHIIGLERRQHDVRVNTGQRVYALRYIVAHDPKRPGVAIPGEGYIGMPLPSDCNWYSGGFIDLLLNGQSLGPTPIHSLTGRSTGDRGTVDFVFDTEMALVRLRFVAKARGDCLYAQVLLEPKQELKSIHLTTRCYPSAWVTHNARRVRTPTRELAVGERADLQSPDEFWALYYDTVYDAGYAGPTYKGVGSCAMLWIPGQMDRGGFTVGNYGTGTGFDLKPGLRDFRFIFFDNAGTANATAQADLQARGPALLQELATFSFTDPSLANWPLAQKQAEVQQALAALPQDQAARAQYEAWGKEIAGYLKQMQENPGGAIMAEANAARLIAQWQRGLPELRLRALLNRI